jgi:hypothetical protein
MPFDLDRVAEALVSVVADWVEPVEARVKALEARLAALDGQAAPNTERAAPSDLGLSFHRVAPDRKRVTYRGAWEPGKAYVPGDGVLAGDGSGWLCRQATSTAAPGNVDAWLRLTLPPPA